MFLLDYPAMTWDISPPAVDDLIKLLAAGANDSVPVNVRPSHIVRLSRIVLTQPVCATR